MSAADEIYNWLIAPIQERMMRAVGRLVRDPDEAADAFQNALAQVWRDLEKIRRHPNPRAYILRVCVSAAYDALRRRARRRRREEPLEEAQAAVEEAGNPAERAVEAERREAVLAAIAALPPQQAQALALRVLEEQPFEVVAQALGCSEATARSHVSKAREKLRSMLKYGNERKPEYPDERKSEYPDERKSEYPEGVKLNSPGSAQRHPGSAEAKMSEP